jgi:hypothetical protein
MALPTKVFLSAGDDYYLWWQENDGQGYPTEEEGGHIIGAGGTIGSKATPGVTGSKAAPATILSSVGSSAA